ncbi:MAG: hypothetical protein ACYTG2_07940 [Planctomycetota bacterium]
MTGNIIAHNVLGGSPRALEVTADASGGVYDLFIEDNVVYDWGGNLRVKGNAAEIVSVTFSQNDLQDLSHDHEIVDHQNADSVASVTSTENSFFVQQLPISEWTRIGASSQPLATWMGLVGDVTSTDQQVLYDDADRSVESYNATLGGTPDLDAFMAEARSQSIANWHAEYTAVQVNAYIRDGFDPVSP